jgi:DNA-binding response OmpR family regulator
MFGGNFILIVEDDPLIALWLAEEVAALEGLVVGPTPTVAEALKILETQEVAAAILDANLADRDVTPVALLLVQHHVPFVICSGAKLPDDLATQCPSLRFVRKPAPPATVIAHLLDAMAQS